MIVVVTGGRDYKDTKHVVETLDAIHKRNPIRLIIHGACPVGDGGADMRAEAWAKSREVPYAGCPARFKTEGRSAGPKRNQLILDKFEVDVVVAFPGGRGTEDMIKRAHQKGIPVELA